MPHEILNQAGLVFQGLQPCNIVDGILWDQLVDVLRGIANHMVLPCFHNNPNTTQHPELRRR